MNIVKELRKSRGIQQKELALSIGVAQPTVSEWESGKKDPSGDRLKRLANFFGVDELYILGMSLSSATINDGIVLDDEEMILITNYRKCLPEYQAIIQQIAGSPENQKKEKASSSAG